VANLLLLARGDEGRTIDQRPVELDVLLLEVARQARALAQGVSVTISHEDQALVRGDADLLKQLLLNLVDNALTYTPPGGQVALALSVADGQARLAVRDTGPGIPPAEVARIFERFYRLDRARSRRSGGPAWGWPSPAGSPRLTAATSRWRAPWARAARSQWCCPCLPLR
jgi:two-component system OmpR family sensor kinase